MANTRRSTRQITSKTQKYREDSSSSSEKAPAKRNVKKSTRQKRAREDDDVQNDKYALESRFNVPADALSWF